MVTKKKKLRYGIETKEHGFYGVAANKTELKFEMERIKRKGFHPSSYKINYQYSTAKHMQKR